ncbi:hypothetical protein H0H92_006821 [Tricholoma furcatifolium]|nr:hypothetical protein H0H92_006821 [Tricholoma furcatifolium]
MANHQLHPLKVNPLTGEPFLTLRNHPNIILTPPRPEDVALWPPIMNDPRIYEWLGNPPIPYLASHAEEWYEKIKDMSDASLSALEAARDASEPILVEHSPVRAIREVNEDGSDTYLGDIGLIRTKEGKFLVSPNEYENEEKKTQCLADNNALPLGDPNIVWSFGGMKSMKIHESLLTVD